MTPSAPSRSHILSHHGPAGNDIVDLDEVAPMDYRFVIRGRRYRLHFDEGAWVLEQLRDGAQDEVEQALEVGSFGEGVNLALDEG